jgi:hypothetical protein
MVAAKRQRESGGASPPRHGNRAVYALLVGLALLGAVVHIANQQLTVRSPDDHVYSL